MKKKLQTYIKFIKKSLDNSDELVKAIKLIEEKINSLPEEEIQNTTLDLSHDIDADFVLFSDGGCRGNPGPGAWGVLGQDRQGNILFENSGFESHTTNNRMELKGVIEALKELQGMNPLIGSQEVKVFTDSKYVVDGISSWVDGWKRRGWKKADNKEPENIDLWKELDRIKSSYVNLSFSWVKGHSGHPQNERCDELANMEMDSHLL